MKLYFKSPLSTIRIQLWFLPCLIVFNSIFSGTTPHDLGEEQNITLSTEFTYTNHSTSTISPKTSYSPMARKTAENKNRTSHLIAAAGTFICILLLVADGFELRSWIILYRRKPNHGQENMMCENGNVYAKVNNVKWKNKFYLSSFCIVLCVNKNCFLSYKNELLNFFWNIHA